MLYFAIEPLLQLIPAMTKPGSSPIKTDSDSGVEWEPDRQLEPASDEGVENEMLCGRRSDEGREPVVEKYNTAMNIAIVYYVVLIAS